MVLNVKELYLYVKRGDFMIGIIGAMEEEVKALLDKTEDIHENKILDCVFYEGKIDNKQVVTRWNRKSKFCYLCNIITHKL